MLSLLNAADDSEIGGIWPETAAAGLERDALASAGRDRLVELVLEMSDLVAQLGGVLEA
jgi:hypothetical protein